MTRYSNSLQARAQKGMLSSFTHVDYTYYHPEWVQIRDCIAGERRIKEKGQCYLPPLDSDLGTVYETYKSRAVYVNMVARTVLGLVGTIFRRPVKALNVEPADQENVTLDGMDINLFAKKCAFEVCSTGRLGVLVDMTDDKPYLTEYIAENIISWRTKMVKGRSVLSYVLLREIVDEVPELDSDQPSTFTSTGGLKARYRVLMLDANGTYRQRLYYFEDINKEPNFQGAEYKEVTPTKNGVAFDFIPMVIMGPNSPTPEVQKSPIYDIVTLNISHYRASAALEHGRAYTAMPVYYVQVSAAQEESGDYHVGPSVVWEVPLETKPGILEYYGTGLKSLQDSLMEREEHIAQLGGRIMGIRPAATAESDNIFRMKQANEMSILLNITESLTAGLTQCFRWYLDWQRKPFADVKIKLNQDFKTLNVAARELRAIALLYQTGLYPVQALFEALQGSEFIPEEWTLEKFQELISDPENFPNQPDVAAMSEGYANAQQKLADETNQRMLDSTNENADMERQHQLLRDQRAAEQRGTLEEQMFKQGTRTAQLDNELAKNLETHKSKLKIKEVKAAPKPKAAAPGAKPAAKKPSAPKK